MLPILALQRCKFLNLKNVNLHLKRVFLTQIVCGINSSTTILYKKVSLGFIATVTTQTHNRTSRGSTTLILPPQIQTLAAAKHETRFKIFEAIIDGQEWAVQICQTEHTRQSTMPRSVFKYRFFSRAQSSGVRSNAISGRARCTGCKPSNAF